ncbi:nuclear transport factor 2 family protein [Streptomyces sp. NPDC002671]
MDLQNPAPTEVSDERPQPRTGERATARANKEIIRRAYREVIVGRDVKAAEELYAADFKQHDIYLPDGRQALIDLTRSSAQPEPPEVGVILAEGEFVVQIARVRGMFREPKITAEIFRVQDQAIRERWGFYMDDPGIGPNGLPVFTANMPFQDTSEEVRSANRQTVKSAVPELYADFDEAVVDRYWSDDYAIHIDMEAPGSGKETLRAFLGMFKQIPGFTNEYSLFVADGNYVAHFNRFNMAPDQYTIALDFIRVQDGLLAERWGVTQADNGAGVNGRELFTPKLMP